MASVAGTRQNEDLLPGESVLDASDTKPRVFRLESLDEAAQTHLHTELSTALAQNPERFVAQLEGAGFLYLQGWKVLLQVLRSHLAPKCAVVLIVPDASARKLAHAAGFGLLAAIRPL